MIRFRLLAAALLSIAACTPTFATAAELGPERVTNGDFSTQDAWTLGYSWQTIPGPLGVAWHNEGYSEPIEQATTDLAGGTTYRVSYTISGSAGSTDPRHWFRMRGAAFANGPVLTGDGTFTFDMTAPTGVYSFQIRPGSGFGGVLDDVSIREILP